MDIAELGMKVVTDQAGNARLVLDDLTAAAGRAEDAAQDLTTASGKLNTSVGKVGTATKAAAQGMDKVGRAGILAGNNTRMLTMQLSQVAQQASATGNVTQALAIQAADIGMVFGTVGTVAGLLATVALPSLVSAFLDTGDRAKAAKDAVEDFGDSISLYRSYVKAATADTATLTAEFGKWAGQMREFSEFMANLQLGVALQDVEDAMTPVMGVLAEVEEWQKAIEEQQRRMAENVVGSTQWAQARENAQFYSEELARLAGSLGLTSDEALELVGAFRAVETAASSRSLSETADAAQRAAAMLDRMFEGGLKVPKPLQEVSGLLYKITEQTAAAATETESLNNWWLQVKRAISDAVAGAPGSGWLAGAISDASTLASKLWDAAKAKAEVFDLTYGQTMGDGSWYNGQTAESLLPPKRYGGLRPPAKGGTGGGTSGGTSGGGGTDGNPRLDSLVQELQTEREILEQWYAESMALLQASSDAELEAIGGRNEAKLRLEQQYQERLRDLRSGYDGDALQQASTFFGEMADAMQGGNEKMLRISRTFAAAQSLINSYKAYTEVLQDPRLPWFARIPAAAGVLAAGMNMVNAIKGGGKGGSSAGRSSTASTPAVQQARPQDVILDFSATMDPVMRSLAQALAGPMIEQLQKVSKTGVNIVAVRA